VSFRVAPLARKFGKDGKVGSTEGLVVANEVEGGKMALKVLVKCVRVPNCACIRIYTYLRGR